MVGENHCSNTTVEMHGVPAQMFYSKKSSVSRWQEILEAGTQAYI